MKLRNAQKLRNGLLIVGIVVMLSGMLYEPMFGVGAVIACSCLIPHILFNKCPHCGKQLGKNEAQYCQFCGKSLDEGQ